MIDPETEINTGEGQMEALRSGVTPQELAIALRGRSKDIAQGGFGRIPRGIRQDYDWGSSGGSGTSASVGSS